MQRLLLSTFLCVLVLAPGQLLAQPWSDNFDSYVPGSVIAGQGNWENWFLGATDAFVSSAQSNSPGNSLEMNPISDVVQQFSGANSGEWIARAMTYVPSSATGQQLFILLNAYNNNGDTSLSNWSTQILLDCDTNLVSDFDQGAASPTLPLTRGQWVQLRVEIDLDSNTQTVFYNNAMLLTESWTEGVPGSGGALNIACLDLFSNGGSQMWYDDVALLEGGPVAIESTSWGKVKSTFR